MEKQKVEKQKLYLYLTKMWSVTDRGREIIRSGALFLHFKDRRVRFLVYILTLQILLNEEVVRVHLSIMITLKCQISFKLITTINNCCHHFKGDIKSLCQTIQKWTDRSNIVCLTITPI